MERKFGRRISPSFRGGTEGSSRTSLLKGEGSNIAVVIPSYNEAENIPLLSQKIFHFLPRVKVIIVDDSSPEENTKLQKALKSEDRIILISRRCKLGRGSAVLAGFKQALKDRKIEYIFEMDADLSHDPGEFQLFLEDSRGLDLVVGSRYLAKSQIIKWPLWRLVLSKLINTFLKVWLGLQLTDYTNGFRLYSRRAVEYLQDANLKEAGFISLSEITFKLKKAGFGIGEVPITFTDRKAGQSNAGIKELLKCLGGAIRIKIQN